MNIDEAYQMVLTDLENKRDETALKIQALKHYLQCPLAGESILGIMIEIDPTLKPGEWHLRKAETKP